MMNDAEKLRALALMLQAIDDCYEELAEFKATIKARIETLLKQSRAIRYEILTGQEQLPLDPNSAQIEEAMKKTAELVNSGALDTEKVKVTASVGPITDEISVEERARERKARKSRHGWPKPGDPPAGEVQP